ncbi:unnamed protein product [Schistocephalus solidus]|uniref:Coiled-coil domain-containing protein 170 n=1 Tax=Schistocephalus solidus TaxID=70667 RepID=A0A183SPD2_SCHSO|nr:unnamed protein product [Schistocephalus solidus]
MQSDERRENETVAQLRRDVREANAHGVYLHRETSNGQREMVSLTKRYEALQTRASEHCARLQEATDNVINLRTELRLKRSEAHQLAEAVNVIRPQLELGNGGLLKQEIEVASVRLRALLQELNDQSALLQSWKDRMTYTVERRKKSLKAIISKTDMFEKLTVLKEKLLTEVAEATERLHHATRRRKKAFDRLTDTRERLSQDEMQAKSELTQIRMTCDEVEEDWTTEHKDLLNKAVDLNQQVDSAKCGAADLLASLKALQSDKATLEARIVELAQEAHAAVKVYWTTEGKNERLREEQREILVECLKFTNTTKVLNETTQMKAAQLKQSWSDFTYVFGKRQTVLDRICSKREQSLAENMQLANIFTDDEGQLFEQVEGLTEELRELSDAKRKLLLLSDTSLMLEGSTFQRKMDIGRQGVATNQEFAWYRGILEYVSDWMHRVYERFRLTPTA